MLVITIISPAAVACKVNGAGIRRSSDIQLVSVTRARRNRKKITMRVNVMIGRSKHEGTLGTHLVCPLFCSSVIQKMLQTYPQHAQWPQVQASG